MILYLFNKLLWNKSDDNNDTCTDNNDNDDGLSISSQESSSDSFVTTPEESSENVSLSLDDDHIDNGESRYGTPRSSLAARYCQRNISDTSSSLSCDSSIEPLSSQSIYPEMLQEVDEEIINHHYRSSSMHNNFEFNPLKNDFGEFNEMLLGLKTPLISPVAMRDIQLEEPRLTLPEVYQNESRFFQLEEEHRDEYNPGGLAPVEFGEELKKEYYIVRKLGFGSFSTVWLTFNKNTKEFSACKISQASFSRYARKELDMMKLIETKRTTNNAERIVKLLDNFYYVSPFGKHLCMVFEPLGRSLYHLIVESEDKGFTMEAIKAIGKHCLEGLRFLHEECNIIHTDIKPENIVIEGNLNELHKYGKFAILDDRMGFKTQFAFANLPSNIDVRMEKSNSIVSLKRKQLLLEKKDQFVKELFSTVFTSEDDYDKFQRDECNDDYDDEEIDDEYDDKLMSILITKGVDVTKMLNFKIVDLGSACQLPYDKVAFIKRQTSQYRAPEATLEDVPTFGMDIWSLACVLYECGTGKYLFDPKKGRSDIEDVKNRFDEYIRLLDLPEPDFKLLHKRCEFINFLFDDDGIYKFKVKHKISLSEHIKNTMDDYNNDFITLMENMLHYSYDKRSTASELLNFNFFQ